MGACATKFQKDRIPDTQIKYHYKFPSNKSKGVPVPDDEKHDEDRINHEPIAVAAIVDDDNTNGANTQNNKPSLDDEVTRATPIAADKSKFLGRQIAIIGAGPAGIHMATLLIKQGYTTDQIIILEKSDRPCGKSYTLTDKDNKNKDGLNDYEGDEIVHEMGTCYLHPEYHAIMSLVDEYDPENKQLGIPSRSVFGTQLNEQHEKKSNEDSPSKVSYTEWTLNKIQDLGAGVNVVPSVFEKLPKLITSGVSFELAIDNYIKVHQEIFGKQSSYISSMVEKIRKSSPIRGFPGRPSPENMKRIDCTFLEFLQQEKLTALVPYFVYSQSVQGYGILDKIPAFYGLFWNTPELMRTTSELLRLAVDKPNVIVLTKGYQSLWEHMIEKHKLNIIYNCNITKLDRHLDDKNKKTEIWYNHNVPEEEKKVDVVDIDMNEYDKNIKVNQDENDDTDDNKEEKDEEKQEQQDAEEEEEETKDGTGTDEKEEEDKLIQADILFLACGCKKALNSFWTDASEEEKKIFSGIEPRTLCSTLFEYDANPELETHQTVVDIWPNICWKGSGQIYAYRNSAKCLMGHEKYDKLIKSGKLKRDRGVSYQYFNRAPKIEEDSPTLLHQLQNDLEVWGEKNIKILRQECWDYMPMWNGEDIQKQYPWIVKDELQGKYKKTFYIGSSVCFESVLNVVEYNYEICNQYCFDDPGQVFFCKKRIGSDKGPFAEP